MGQDFFKFKQFTIRQDACAMKVCTDACILGSLVPVKEYTNTILDIGSGTGLLSLMLAQRTLASIDAVEIVEAAAKQSFENVLHSPWSDRINIHHQSIQEFSKDKLHCYDLIVCNPPFFEKNLITANIPYNIACHSSDLSLEELVNVVATLLLETGVFVVMLPDYESKKLQTIAEKAGLHCYFSISIKHREHSKIIRKINFFSNESNNQFGEDKVIIKGSDEHYTERFRELLTPFYSIF